MLPFAATVVMVLMAVTSVTHRVSPGAADQANALRIVVIAGEDAVNIVQQKTAVAPIVEVRDRNDQPVAGAVVNFAIRNGRASFGAARTLSVTTDVAGRAVASGLTPSAAGTLEISASTVVQGQTATVTIAQTNVMTAAQAAAVSGGSGSGSGASGATGAAGGSGGGGLSGLTIGAIAGGLGAGALVAISARDSGGATTPSGAGGGTAFVPRVYSMIFAPAVATVSQCPQAASVPGAGPTSTSVVPQSDGTFLASLFLGVSGSPGTPVVTISGRATATDFTGAMSCIGGGGPAGNVTATGSPSQYQGTWTFGTLSGSLSVVPQ